MRSLNMRTSLLATAAVGLVVALVVGGLSVVRMSAIADAPRPSTTRRCGR